MPPRERVGHTYRRLVDLDGQDSLAAIARRITPGSCVLELGVATGYFSRLLKERLGCVVDGVDLAADMAEEARPWCRRLLVADLEREALADHFPRHCYDFIVCADVLEHLRDAGAILTQLPELLAEGGKVLASVPNVAYAGLLAELVAGEFRYRDEGLLDRSHLRFFTRASFERLLQDHGFSVEAVEPVRLPFERSEFRHLLREGGMLPPEFVVGPDADAYQYVFSAVPAGKWLTLRSDVLVDVIVPVYRGLQETSRCLESVLRYPQDVPFQVVVINDATPEPLLSEYLRGLETQGKILLRVNSANRGFVQSVNLAMALHPERDAVLLNSDSEVHGKWLDRLRRAAYSAPNVGTVGPFSNNATICSYPRFCHDNRLPGDCGLAALDDLFARVNRGQQLPIPTTVGFCMYIRRDCLERVGYFDAVQFPRGYGEENDFCMRARELGFVHLLCADTFVYHQGSVSFGAKKAVLYSQAQAEIARLHPEYPALVQAHVEADSARSFRRRVDLARLAVSRRPRLLFVTHNIGGGTERHIQDLSQLLEERFEVLLLRPRSRDSVVLGWARGGEEFEAYFRIPLAFDRLIDLLRQIGLVRIHIHHLIGHHLLVTQLPKRLGVPYDYTLHDYFAVCPQFNLTLADGRYCGEPDTPGCNRCLEERPSQWQLDIQGWRTLFSDLLESADRVIGPSRDVISRTRGYVPRANYVYLPHPALNEKVPRTREVKVLVLGALSLAKGAKLLESCARDARARRLPLYFRGIGSPSVPLAHELDVPLSFTGPYRDDDLPALIARERGDVVLFPAQWPETYSYTLSAALDSGLPVVAPRLGAFAERLAAHGRSQLFDWEATPDTVNNALLAAASGTELSGTELSGPEVVRQMVPLGVQPERYLQEYLSRLPAEPGARAAPSLDDLAALLPPDSIHADSASFCPQSLSRAELLDLLTRLAPVRAPGNGTTAALEAWRRDLDEKLTSLGHLQAEVATLTATLGEAQEGSQQLREEVDRLQQQLGEREATIAEMKRSRLWRVMQPARVLGTVLKTRSLRGVLSAPALMRGGLGARIPQGLKVVAAEGVTGLRRRVARSVLFPAQVRRAVYPYVPVDEGEVSLEAVDGRLDVAVSVIIPTRNAGRSFSESLSKIKAQCGVGSVEILVMDSGSTDGTPTLARATGARVTALAPEDFHHARTRNEAARQAAGEILVFTVQDAVPPGRDWLHRLVSPLVSGKADAVSARQIPRADADLFAQWAAWGYFRYLGFHSDALRCGKDYPMLQALAPDELRRAAHLDNVCMAIGRGLFEKFEFSGAYGEDLDLGSRLLAAGHRLLFQVDNAVIHSHSRPAAYFFRREYVNTLSLAHLLGRSLGERGPQEILPSLRRAYDLFCGQLPAWTQRTHPSTDLAAALALLMEALKAAWAGGKGEVVPEERDPALYALLGSHSAPFPEPHVLDSLGERLGGDLHSFGQFMVQRSDWGSPEVALVLHKFYAAAAGAIVASSGAVLPPRLLAGV